MAQTRKLEKFQTDHDVALAVDRITTERRVSAAIPVPQATPPARIPPAAMRRNPDVGGGAVGMPAGVLDEFVDVALN